MDKKYRKIPVALRYLINFVLLAAILVIGIVLINAKVISNYYTKILMIVGINMILAVSLNVATGYLGQLPLGHAGFMAVGAYASAIFMLRTGLPTAIAFPIGIIFGGIISAVAGIIIGIPALRLRGDYLAIITLGFGEIIRVILLNIDSVLGFTLTNGAAGLQNIPKTTTFANTFVCVVLTCFFIHTLMKSKQGRAILSIRENEIAADSCGINTTYYKTLGFTVSAFFAGVAGALYGGAIGLLTPGSFGFMKSIEILVMVVLGGMGSMAGSLVSAAVLTAVPEVLRAFADYRMLAYAFLLIIVMIFKPSGLMGRYDFSFGGILEKLLNGKLFKNLRAKNRKAGESDE